MKNENVATMYYIFSFLIPKSLLSGKNHFDLIKVITGQHHRLSCWGGLIILSLIKLNEC